MWLDSFLLLLLLHAAFKTFPHFLFLSALTHQQETKPHQWRNTYEFKLRWRKHSTCNVETGQFDIFGQTAERIHIIKNKK